MSRKSPPDVYVSTMLQESEFQTEAQLGKLSQLVSSWTLCTKNSTRQNEQGGSIAVREAAIVSYTIETIDQRIYCILHEPQHGSLWGPPNADFDFLFVRNQKDEWPETFLHSPKFLPERNT